MVLPYINMHPPWVYTGSPSWTPRPRPFPYYPSGSSQCTSPKLPVSCIEPGLAIRFLYDIIHVLIWNFKEIFSLPIIKVKTALVVVHTFTKLLFSHSVTSDSLWPHGLQHTSFPVLHHLLELAQTHVHWAGDAIQPSCPLLSPFSSCLQSFPASGAFLRSWLFTLGGQNIGTSASASVLPMNIQGWFPLGLTGLISLLYKRLSRVFPNTTVQKHQFFGVQPSLWSDSHIHTWLLEKP